MTIPVVVITDSDIRTYEKQGDIFIEKAAEVIESEKRK